MILRHLGWAALLGACAKSAPIPAPAPSSVPSSAVATASAPPPANPAPPCEGENEPCTWEREDRAMGVGDRATTARPEAAFAAMETRRAKVFACVAQPQQGSTLAAELRQRVRIRATFGADGRIVSALFATQTQGYGLADKYSHLCIVDALSPIRLGPGVVTYTYAFADAATK